MLSYEGRTKSVSKVPGTLLSVLSRPPIICTDAQWSKLREAHRAGASSPANGARLTGPAWLPMKRAFRTCFNVMSPA